MCRVVLAAFIIALASVGAQHSAGIPPGAERAYQARETEIAPELERRRIRYVVAHRFPTFLERAPEDGSLFHALFASVDFRYVD